MKKALVKLFEMNAEEEINKINVDFFESRVNERGLNRLVRFDQYIETINKREIQVQMADPEKRAQLIAELRAKIKSVNIDDLE
jgi:NADP-dependent 3-hydroxy acid dehydrogenase YdfG